MEDIPTGTSDFTDHPNVCRGGYLNGWTFKQTSEKKTISYRGNAYDRTDEKDEKGRTIWQYRKV